MSKKKDYAEYLKSDKWIQRRDLIREQRKFCEICRSDKDLHVHHITYENLGKEKDDDLVLVCKDCHYAIHKGSYIVVCGLKGSTFYKNNRLFLTSFNHTKINRFYFPKDKSVILKGNGIVIEHSNGEQQELKNEKWYVISKR